jgi:3'-phosphoadenosine 5'-phosphosulfate sulfotransferase (PAPS reductase)/FAD synthetase
VTVLYDKDALIARIAGRRVIASVSGGKDSAAMSLHLTELGIEHDRVFLDTGWEHAKTYEYLRGELTRVIGPIIELRGDYTMEELVVKKGMFPSRVRRFCTEELKVFPLQRYINTRVDAGEDLVNTVGIRRAESEARLKMTEWEWSKGFDCEVWRPLVTWTEDEVIAIHKRHGLAPNPLYLMGASRVGCYPCIFARKNEIRFISDESPQRIDLIRMLEAKVGAAAAARDERKGEERHRPLPTFFQSPLRDENGERLSVPIDDVVAWAHTSHGGRQMEMFAADPGDAGCMRWGLCDHDEES